LCDACYKVGFPDARCTALHPSHPHKLVRNFLDDGWACEARKHGGCKCHITDFGQTRGIPRYTCSQGCDYSLCDRCYISGLQNVLELFYFLSLVLFFTRFLP
jgi:hypothetical protein